MREEKGPRPRYFRSGYRAMKNFGLAPVRKVRTSRVATRYDAIKEVLRRIPPVDYRSLKYQSRSLWWFLPEQDSPGYAARFRAEKLGVRRYLDRPPGTFAIIFLHPLLEFLEPEAAVVVVAHELAHIFGGYGTILESIFGRRYESHCEKAALRQVKRWGFNKESKLEKKLYGLEKERG